MKLLDKEVVATIASRKSLSFKAKELGLRVNNSELKDKIKNSYLFQQNGNFIGFKEYENKVRNIFGLNHLKGSFVMPPISLLKSKY